MEKLLFIKLGGSLITDKKRPLVAKERVVLRLAKEIKLALGNYKGKVIVGHGSGSFGHAAASKYQTQKGIVNPKSIKGVSEVADVASRLTKIVVKAFRKAGLPVVAFAPIAFILSEKQKESRFFVEPVREALKRGVIPLVYGDVVFDKSQGFGIFSTEKVINVLAKGLSKTFKIDRIIHCGDSDGVYDGTGKTISLITTKSFGTIKKLIGTSSATDVTGGMIHKVKESLEIARRYKTKVLIISGKKKGNLKKAILGKPAGGTLVSS